MAPKSVTFPFDIGDKVKLKDVPHLGGRVSSLSLRGGNVRVGVRHFDAEGDSADREFDGADLESGDVSPPPPKPTASPGAPPSAATPSPTASAAKMTTASVAPTHAIAAPAATPAPAKP